MKFKVLLFLMFCSNYCLSQLVTNPSPFEVNETITITIDENSTLTNCNGFNNPEKVYMHAGVGNDNEPWGYSVIGNWGQDDGVGEMIENGDGTWSISLNLEDYFGLTVEQATSVTKMGLVFRNENGSQEFKDNGCSDFFLNVGSFQVELINPDSSGIILTNYNDSSQIIAQNTNCLLYTSPSPRDR